MYVGSVDHGGECCGSVSYVPCETGVGREREGAGVPGTVRVMLVFACARAASAPTAMAERILISSRGISGPVCEADGENLMEVCLLVDSTVGLPESANESGTGEAWTWRGMYF